MWTRAELKGRAKLVLANVYWKAFLISLVIAVAGGNTGISSNGGSSSGRHNGNSGSFDSIPAIPTGFLIGIVSLIAVISLVVIVLILAYRILIGYPLEVGGRKYFVQSAQCRDNKGCFSFAFYSQNYKGIVSTMLLKGVQNFLWYLLFIIPGIIKSYEYRMVPYILADNPNIGSKRAIELSRSMTMGHKWDMFVLDLSFIGWYLLGALALGVGVLFVMPYENATNAELYLVLRDNATTGGYCSSGELC